MNKLNLPSYNFRIKEEGDKKFIFDEVRNKFLSLTPEEWVRQNFIKFLIQERKFPSSLISIEKGLKLNELQKRADAVVYSKSGEMIVLIEFKAPKIKINQETFEQIARYNSVFKVEYLIVTNGINHYCAKINFVDNSFSFLKEIPSYIIL